MASELGERPREFDRVEIVCPDDRWYPLMKGALEIRVFGGMARRRDAIDTLTALQYRFRTEPGILTVNVRRHHDCGFRIRPGESNEAVKTSLLEEFGRLPHDLPMFDHMAADLGLDLEVLKSLRWLPGTKFSGYITDVESGESQRVCGFSVPG